MFLLYLEGETELVLYSFEHFLRADRVMIKANDTGDRFRQKGFSQMMAEEMRPFPNVRRRTQKA